VAQNDLNVNILANVKGAEQIAALINRVGALEKEMSNLQRANAGVAASTDAVIRNGVRYNNALDAQSKELRNARQGTQQLGMQINDFATSVSTGASITQAFSQQLGQVGYAMSMMGGTAGKIGSFLAGPWGAAVLIGAVALQPIIDKLFQSEEAAKKAADAHYRYLDAVAAGNMADLIKAEGELTKMQQKRLELQLKLDKTSLPGGQMGDSRFAPVPGERRRIQEQINQMDQDIRWQQLAIDRGNTAREQLAASQKKVTSGSSRSTGGSRDGGGSANSALREAERLAKEQAKIDEWIAERKIAADMEWRSYWTKAQQDQEIGLQEHLAFMGTMADATVQVMSDRLIKPFDEQLKMLNESYARIGTSVADAFQGMLTGATSWKDGMKGIINAVINELWRLYVVQQIVGLVTSALGSFGLPLPGRANGGGVTGNKPYMVGERGPELFIPNRTGTIIPNHNLKSESAGGGMTINVDARGANDPAAVRAQVQRGILEAAPAIIAAAEARTVSGLRRPRLGGAIK